jgi:hypothetical protein
MRLTRRICGWRSLRSRGHIFVCNCCVQPGSTGVLLLSSGTRVLKLLPDKLLIEASHDATNQPARIQAGIITPYVRVKRIRRLKIGLQPSLMSGIWNQCVTLVSTPNLALHSRFHAQS